MNMEENTMKLFKKPLAKLIGASIPLVLVGLVAFAGTQKAGMTPINLDSPENAMYDGGSDYSTHCARCHGSDGRSQTAKGRKTNATDLTKSRVGDAKGIRIITHGAGEMPDFKTSMTADQIRNVMGYVKGFRQ